MISIERSDYSDPITAFIEELYISSNFDEAQSRLKECAAAIDQDFFLSNSETDFMTHARLYTFESYCRWTVPSKRLVCRLSLARDDRGTTVPRAAIGRRVTTVQPHCACRVPPRLRRTAVLDQPSLTAVLDHRLDLPPRPPVLISALIYALTAVSSV